MADEQEKETRGTPEPGDVDATEEEVEGESQEPEGSDTPESVDWKQKYEDLNALRLKDLEKIESANTLKRELDALKESVQASLATGGSETDARAERLRRLRKAADDGDFLAEENLELRGLIDEVVYGIQVLNDLNRIKDEDEREMVRKEFSKGTYRDVRTARSVVREAILEKQNAELREALKEKEGKKPPRDTIRTDTRETTARGKVRRMSLSEWDAEQSALKDAGRHREAMARQRQWRKGEIVVKD